MQSPSFPRYLVPPRSKYSGWDALDGDIKRVKVKVKVKYTLEQATKAHRGVEV